MWNASVISPVLKITRVLCHIVLLWLLCSMNSKESWLFLSSVVQSSCELRNAMQTSFLVECIWNFNFQSIKKLVYTAYRRVHPYFPIDTHRTSLTCRPKPPVTFKIYHLENPQLNERIIKKTAFWCILMYFVGSQAAKKTTLTVTMTYRTTQQSAVVRSCWIGGSCWWLTLFGNSGSNNPVL